MANYLTSVCHEKTAVLEWNNHGDFIRMGRFCTGMEDYCSILDVDYHADVGAETFIRCLNGDYHRILVDFGENSEEHLRECARCDRKVIVGAFSEWQTAAFLEEVKRDKKRDKSWGYAAAFGSEETRREVEKAFSVTCMRIPASVDAFAVTRTDMRFFEQLLKVR